MKQVICLLAAGALMANGQTSPAPVKSARTATATNSRSSPSDQDLNYQAYVQFLKTDPGKQKTRIISNVMQFDAGQAAAFWPIYKDFASELSAIGDQLGELVKDYVQNYDALTDDVAGRLATKLLEIEEQRNGLKRRYYEKFKVALDPVTAARFLQVENQIEKLVDLQVASQLPVVGGSGKK
jgi:hypothetical protein